MTLHITRRTLAAEDRRLRRAKIYRERRGLLLQKIVDHLEPDCIEEGKVSGDREVYLDFLESVYFIPIPRKRSKGGAE